MELSLTQSFMDENVRKCLFATASCIFKDFHFVDEQDKTNMRHLSLDSKPLAGVVIDPKYCDNEKFSDIQFIVDGQTIFAHRIVISTHRGKFESALQHSSSTVHVDDIN